MRRSRASWATATLTSGTFHRRFCAWSWFSFLFNTFLWPNNCPCAKRNPLENIVCFRYV